MSRVPFLCALILCVVGRSLEGDLYTFNDFKATYGRQYTPAEEAARFTCFQANLDIIDQLNANADSGRHGINSFTDLCPEEFKAMHNLKFDFNRTTNYDTEFSQDEVKQLTASPVDWRTKGAVTHVKNQGMCGSCWSFSATGNMEGQHFLKSGTLVSLSEEELVQCANNGNYGCNGGLMDLAFAWVVKNGGIASEQEYPYSSGSGNTGSCKKAKEQQYKVAKFSGYVDVAKNEEQMAAWVSANGPLAIGVDASNGWQTYSGGIVKNCNGRSLDHGVLIVGFGTEGSTNYWIVKNSWGTSWGENGYIRLQQGTDQCGITMSPSSAKAE